jgi:2-hydroxychromene-2-carboxylate isomerase
MKVSWVFDVVSPFSYLSLKQLPRLAQYAEIEYVPVLFAGLLNHHGQIGNAEIESKRRFTYRFALWRARTLGIPMCMPPTHPFNPLPGLRLIIAAGSTQAAVESVFDAAFMHNLDLGSTSVISGLARRLGVTDPLRAVKEQSIKQSLRENTDWAIARGVFGVPTFVVGGELFWGHDSLEMVIDYLLDPGKFSDAEMQWIDRLPVGAMRSNRKS